MKKQERGTESHGKGTQNDQAKAEQQVTTNAQTRLCSVDLNITQNLAVCTILTVEGTVVATRFIKGGRQLHGLRKRQLGRIARNRSKTGIIAEGEQDNAALWAKIRSLDEESAHHVSHRIVEFVQQYQASMLVFEHLGHFKPCKGTYSRRGNEKRAYWLRGKIFKYGKYKAWNEGIVTCRVSPRNTSRDCARCGMLVVRYDAGKPAEGYTPGAPLVYCPQCHMRGNADRNASIVIGKRLLARYQQSRSQEKPHAPLATYLKFEAQMSTIHVEDMSWMRTCRKKLPPVRAHPVYHSQSRPSPPGAPLCSQP